MEVATRQKTPAFIAFKAFTEQALASGRQIACRLDCLNPVKAIKHDFDFSIEPAIGLTAAWEDYLGLRFEESFHSAGVRVALRAIFRHLKGRTVSLPANEYPVYQQIAQEEGVEYVEYSTLPRHTPLDALKSDIMLLTAPLATCGKDMSPWLVDMLVRFLKGDPKRRLIIDRVYDYDRSPVVQPLIDTNQVFVCYSLSKSHLSPMVAGFTICPKGERLCCNGPEIEDDKAKVLMGRYRDFPLQQASVFRHRWIRLAATLQAIDPNWTPPGLGYLSTIGVSAEKLLENGILVVPGDVYNMGEGRSVVSCLHETNDFDGFQKQGMYYVTVMSNFARGYDKYTQRYDKSGIGESTFKDKFYLLGPTDIQVGFDKARRLLQKTVAGDSIVVLRTLVNRHELRPNTTTGLGKYVERSYIDVDFVFDGDMNGIQVEDAYAASLALNPLLPWAEVRPRSMSVLPIAQACQARCEFCFSHSSVSDDQRQGKVVLARLDEMCDKSKALGAERLVITGGGEPTLLAHGKLLDIIRTGREHFPKVVLITNGHALGNMEPIDRMKTLWDYYEAGLNVIAVSRHSPDRNHEIMKIDTKSERIARAISDSHMADIAKGLTMRWICVLQKQGVRDEKTLHEYLLWAASTGVTEVCFKELYVAVNRESEYHDSKYNRWCAENQVPLSLVTGFMRAMGAKKVAELPWGSPVYEYKCDYGGFAGRKMKVAAYTEPSVFWERHNGVCRSWNLMADGTCYANLETPDSIVDAPAGKKVALAMA